MAPSAAVRSLLGTDPDMITLGLTTGQVWTSSALDTPVDRDLPWCVLQWEETIKSFGTVGQHVLTVWFHESLDRTHDYGVVNGLLDRAVELLVEAQHVIGADGWVLSAASWQGCSGDLTDQAFNSLARYCRFRVAGRPVI